MTDGSLFVNANNFNRTMTLVDKELKSSKEEFILHFKRDLPMNCQEEPLWKE